MFYLLIIEKIWTIVIVPILAIYAFIWQWKDRREKSAGKPLIARITEKPAIGGMPYHLKEWTALDIALKNIRDDDIVVKKISVSKESGCLLARAGKLFTPKPIELFYPDYNSASSCLNINWRVRSEPEPSWYFIPEFIFVSCAALKNPTELADAKLEHLNKQRIEGNTTVVASANRKLKTLPIDFTFEYYATSQPDRKLKIKCRSERISFDEKRKQT